MKTTLLGYMAVDQYGETIKLTSPKHPRKQLLEKLGVKSAGKMFVDGLDGDTRHIGYISSSRWFTIHEVHAWTGKV